LTSLAQRGLIGGFLGSLGMTIAVSSISSPTLLMQLRSLASVEIHHAALSSLPQLLPTYPSDWLLLPRPTGLALMTTAIMQELPRKASLPCRPQKDTGFDLTLHRLLRALRKRSGAWSYKALDDDSRKGCGAGDLTWDLKNPSWVEKAKAKVRQGHFDQFTF
jgi:hypothetical protein